MNLEPPNSIYYRFNRCKRTSARRRAQKEGLNHLPGAHAVLLLTIKLRSLLSESRTVNCIICVAIPNVFSHEHLIHGNCIS